MSRGKRKKELVRALCGLAMAALTGCGGPADDGAYQGYAEADYRYLASPVGGYLTELHVDRGQSVAAGDALYALDGDIERRQAEQARADLEAARARLEDARKGEREPVIQSLGAAADALEADLKRLRLQLDRQTALVESGASPQENLDDARLGEQRVAAQLRQARAQLTAAELPAREDVIAALAAQVEAREASLRLAQWQLEQTRRTSPAAAVVENVLYRPGEWVPAGRPVVVLFPPDDMRAYFYVSDAALASIQAGDPLELRVDGVEQALEARVAAISSDPEYTPPVIFSNETRGKLLYRIEARLSPEAARRVHPGQPLRIRPAKAGATAGAPLQP